MPRITTLPIGLWANRTNPFLTSSKGTRVVSGGDFHIEGAEREQPFDHGIDDLSGSLDVSARRHC
ncbi:MAG: hypothetical protein U0236_05300 [Nitrospira sp.]